MKFYESGEYRATKDWPYALAAGCVVFRENEKSIEVLLLKRNAHNSNNPTQINVSYNLPKGHVDIGESPEQTAIRETREEAGCEGEIVTFLGASQHNFVHPKFEMKNVKTTLFYAMHWLKDVQFIDSEHDDICWVSLGEASRLLKETDTRGEQVIIDRLKKFLELI